MAYQITGNGNVFNNLFGLTQKTTVKLHVIGPFYVNPLGVPLTNVQQHKKSFMVLHDQEGRPTPRIQQHFAFLTRQVTFNITY